MPDNRQQEDMKLTAEDIERMEESGQWCYASALGRMVNIHTGEIMEVLQWLQKDRQQ